jgi:quercetin dioxygenase-like cupin family protein
MPFTAILPDDLHWITRAHDPGEPARHVAELSERAGFQHMRGNFWRYEPGAKGRRHQHKTQEEIFVVISGTLSAYLGGASERHDIPAGGVVHVSPGTPIQAVNHGNEDLLLYASGYPPENERAEILDPAV